MSDVKHTEERTETHECVPKRTETHGDTVSREDAIEAVRSLQTYKLDERDDMLLVDLADVQTELMMMPPAEPERKTGHWIEHYGDSKCSECGYELKIYDTNYCPNCGADMRGEQNG